MTGFFCEDSVLSTRRINFFYALGLGFIFQTLSNITSSFSLFFYCSFFGSLETNLCSISSMCSVLYYVHFKSF